jgi:tRNA pseudouridine13 synthase
MRPELLSLYLSAYQSHLWNRMLALWLRQHCRPEQLISVPLRLGAVPMPRGLEPPQLQALSGLQLPLPSARLHLEPDDERLSLLQAVMAEEGLDLNQLKLKGLRKPFFSRGDRAAMYLLDRLTFDFQPDEDHAGREKLLLAFELPRGSYATLIVKRLQTVEPQMDADEHR